MRRLLLFALPLTVLAQPTPPTGFWQATGRLAEARAGACAVALNDGTILVAGGSSAAASLASVELYQAEGVFTQGTAMQTGRSGHTCTLLADGRVLAAGGDDAGQGSAELYDPVAATWTLIPGAGIALNGHTATLLPSGSVLLAAGAGLVYFDAQAGALYPLASTLATGRKSFASTLLADGRVLITGGQSDSAVLNSTEIFDPSDFSVSPGPAMNVARAEHSAVLLDDGRVVVIGGLSSQGETNTAELLDAAAGAWTLAPGTMRDARRRHLSVFVPGNGGVLVAGGISCGQSLASTELFQADSSTFHDYGDLTQGRSAMAGAIVGSGQIIAIGGLNSSGPQAACGLTAVPVITFNSFATSTVAAPSFVHPATIFASGHGFGATDTAGAATFSTAAPGTRFADASSRLISPKIPMSAVSAGGNGFAGAQIVTTLASDVGKQVQLSVRGSSTGFGATTTTTVKSAVTLSSATPRGVFTGQSLNYSITLTPNVDAGPLTGQVQAQISPGGSVFAVAAPVVASQALPGTTSGPVTITLPIPFATVGAQAVRITYMGDAKYAASVTTYSVQVYSRTPLVTFLLPATGIIPGVPASLIVRVTPDLSCQNCIPDGPPLPLPDNVPLPTGSISFSANGVASGTIPLMASKLASSATVSPVTANNAGSLTLGAAYGGDSFYTAASGFLTVVPQKVSTSVSVSGPSILFTGQAGDFDVTVTPAAPATPMGGNITASVSAGGIGSSTSAGSVAVGNLSPPATRRLTLPFASAGISTLTFGYTGDSTYAASTSPGFRVNVFGRGVTSFLLLSPAQPVVGSPVTITAAIFSLAVCGSASTCDPISNTINLGQQNIPTPSGTVAFQLNTGTIATATLTGSNRPGVGLATITFTPTATTPLQFSLAYSGDSFYTSGTTLQTVTPVPAPTTLSFVNPPATYVCGGVNVFTTRLTFPALIGLTNRTVTFGTLSAGAFSPIQTFTSGGVFLSTGTLVPDASTPGQATAAGVQVPLNASITQLAARFTGDSNLKAAPDAIIPLAMQKILPANSLRSSQGTTATGAVTFTATYQPSPLSSCRTPTPTGTVQFFDSTLLLNVVPLDASGVAALTTSRPAGSRGISAVYSGDAFYLPLTLTLNMTFQ